MIGRFVSPHRLTLYVVAIALPLLLVGSHVAAAGREPTAIAVAAPASATLGEQVTVQARLGMSSGPVADATVQFAVPTSFLNGDGDMAWQPR